jgi:hypothetical protein
VQISKKTRLIEIEGLTCKITVSCNPRPPVPEGASAKISPSPSPPTSAGHGFVKNQKKSAVAKLTCIVIINKYAGGYNENSSVLNPNYTTDLKP